ncbi:transposase family protein [Nocardia sp. CA-084685]|uniref:transposase family protein n=1 Tax=Nocardia sp. CA-084685 TaxID=3239970 RepID=UPI003D97A591
MGTSAARGASCPECAFRSVRVHSRYQRCLSDAAVGGVETVICLRARRFYCGTPIARERRSPNRSRA